MKMSLPHAHAHENVQWIYEGEGSAPSCRAQQTVALWCPWYTLISSPVDMDQSLAVVSEEATWMKDGGAKVNFDYNKDME